jgi:hypothetical protein
MSQFNNTIQITESTKSIEPIGFIKLPKLTNPRDFPYEINQTDQTIQTNPLNQNILTDQIKEITVGIADSIPYDTSTFLETETSKYIEISYSDIEYLTIALNTNDATKLTNSNLLYIYECINLLNGKSPDLKIMFRFLCSADCYNGSFIKSHTLTNTIHNFINNVTLKGCDIELSDHSLAAICNTWNKENYGLECPFIISGLTTSGNYIMKALKNDLINSEHQILKIVGELSDSDIINITFNNMGGTKIYSLNTKSSIPVTILSKGKENNNNRLKQSKQSKQSEQGESMFDIFDTNIDYIPKSELDIVHHGNKQYQVHELDDSTLSLVHTKFKLNNGTIYCSATHWCNLLQVETDVNISTLRSMTEMYCGENALNDLDIILSTGDETTLKREMSNYIREISSGGSENYQKKQRQ